MPISELPPNDLIQQKLIYSVLPTATAAAVAFAVGAIGSWVVFGVLLKRAWRRAIPLVAVVSFSVGLATVPLLNDWAQSKFEAAREADDKQQLEQLYETYKFEETFPLVPDGKWWHWGFYAVAMAVGVELIARLPGVGIGVGHLFRGTAAGVIAATVVAPDWQEGPDRWTIPLTAAAFALLWSLTDAVGRRTPGGTWTACLSLIALGAACVSIHDDVARFTDFATFVSVALAVVAVGGWITRADVSSAAAVGVVPVLTVLLITRHLAAPLGPDDTKRVPAIAYWLVGLAPLFFGQFLIPPVTRFGTRWYSAPVKLLLVLIPVGIAVYLCVTQAPLAFDEEAW